MGKRFPEFVVNPSDIVAKYGADTLRLYEMFMGALEASKPWNDQGVEGARRFVNKVWKYFSNPENISEEDPDRLTKIYHQTVRKVTSDFETLGFNTAIAQMMIFMNEATKGTCPSAYAEGFVKMFSCVCPHSGEELWNRFGHDESIAYAKWPEYDEALCKEDVIEIGVQVNGKVKGVVGLTDDATQDSALEKAREIENVEKALEGKNVVKVIFVKGKILNIVVK
jgi:leucyl-tRNA synthetase